jgi:RNA-binding protein
VDPSAKLSRSFGDIVTMNLTNEQQKYLRKLAHDLDPVIWVGQSGLTDNVIEELKSALNHHELVKVRIRAGERDLRNQITIDITHRTNAIIVQKIGNSITLFRRNTNKPSITFP